MEKSGALFLPQARVAVSQAKFATDLAAAANDVIQAITFDQATWVYHAYLVVNTGTTGACNAALGKADGAELMAATTIATAGNVWTTPTTFVPVLFAAAGTLDVHFSADAAGGNITVVAVVLGAGDNDGNDES